MALEDQKKNKKKVICYWCCQCKPLLLTPAKTRTFTELDFANRRIPIECRKTKAKVITLTNHKGHRQSSEPIKTRSKCMLPARSVRKCVRANYDWLWLGLFFQTDHYLIHLIFILFAFVCVSAQLVEETVSVVSSVQKTLGQS